MRKIITIWVVTFILSVGLVKTSSAELVVSETTSMMFSDKEVLVFQDASQSLSAQEVLNSSDKFVNPKNIKSFAPSVNYWILQKIKSQLPTDRVIQIDASGWRDVQPHVLYADGQLEQLKPTGFIGARNAFLEISPSTAKIADNLSQFPIFTLRAGSEVKLLTRVSFHPIFPAKSFSLNLADSASFSEFRRFSLYVEGLLLGILLALTIFSIFNAVQTKDRVNIYYAIWITIAFLSVSSLSLIDGHRLF